MDAAMIFRVCATALAVLVISSASADAQIFGGHRAPSPVVYHGGHGFGAALDRVKSSWHSTGVPSKWKGPPPRYVAPDYYDNLNERYPKFYGGFHSSYFHNMGLPPGDIGPRGNGIYPTPW